MTSNEVPGDNKVSDFNKDDNLRDSDIEEFARFFEYGFLPTKLELKRWIEGIGYTKRKLPDVLPVLTKENNVKWLDEARLYVLNHKNLAIRQTVRKE